VHRVYRYRLYPTRAQDASLRATLEILREVYNAALQERRDAWKKQRVAVRRRDQMLQLKLVRADRADVRAVHVHLLQDACWRLDRAYAAFFRRCKAGEKLGYPRFKGRGRYRTFTFQDCKKKRRWLVAGGKRLSLTGIGDVKIKLHRPYEGTLKQVSVTLSGDGHWYALLCCAELPAKPLPATGQCVGVDVGIRAFATLSNGESVENPRPHQAAQRKLKTAQRRVSRRERGSARRRAAVVLLANRHDKVARVRRDFHHKTARDLVQRFDSIAIEDLNIKGLAAGMLAKQVTDAAWAQFISILAYKAESAGRELIKVDPRGTSQECSECGAVVRKSLAVRVHTCPECGLVLDRDHNAAINIGTRAGHALRGGPGNGRLAEPRSLCLAR
jgi:putative transposase